MTVSGQNRQICERTLKFVANFYAALVNFQGYAWDSPQEKNSVLKKVTKKPNFEVVQKVSFVLKKNKKINYLSKF